MIKKLLMAAAVVVMAVPAAAQGSRRSEISVSYGFAPVTDWICLLYTSDAADE